MAEVREMTATATRTWETVIGLEVHCELSTTSKLFCGCPNEFGDEPNTNVCPVCLGLPGSLPVLNERAVEFALRVAEALHLHVPAHSIFSRKNYFYPDMPKNYQTSQYDEPITRDGWIDVDGTRVGITRAHLEEDTGKSLHVGGGGRIHDAEYSLVDYNRAGVPLLEIVSEPDIRSAEQAKRYVEELRGTLLAIGVSDVKMEEGSLRIDANISVRPEGSTEFGTRAEIKNLNSLRSLVRAVEFETRRQAGLLGSGERVVQETRHWDEDGGRTISGRSKEEAHDYRYFPEPDLVPVAPTDAMRAEVRASMPELPAPRRARLVEGWGIKDEDARVLVDVPGLADYAERAVAALKSGTPKDVANWVRQDVLAFLNDRGLAPAVLTPEMLAELVGLVADGTISRGQAKDVLLESMEEEKWPDTIVRERGLAQVSDAGELGAVVDAVLARESATVEQYRASTDDKDRKKKRNALMGQVMAELKGKGNPQLVNQLLDDRLS
jgi:aspartyl-tRNA(Asn)/glutamyl-tRNA(Gln) amidotransferase subunit B